MGSVGWSTWIPSPEQIRQFHERRDGGAARVRHAAGNINRIARELKG
jgi:hypothetical protein